MKRQIIHFLTSGLLLLLSANTAVPGITDAVVRVSADDAAGCGTLIQSDGTRGYVLTAAHVVGRGRAIRAQWHDGYVAIGRIAAIDHHLDVAILSVVPPSDAITIPLAGENQWPAPRETVELIGYGGGNLRHWTAAVNGYVHTEGIGRSQTLAVNTQTIGGDSGGAIVYRGRLVAVIWGGPLAAPRGPMLATHGTCCVAINNWLEANEIRLGVGALAQFGPPACRGPSCPLPPRIPLQKPIPKTHVPSNQQLIARIAKLESELAALQRHRNLNINLEDIQNQLIDRLAVDPRFRGRPGRDGANGNDGRDGDVNVENLAEQVKRRLAGSIRIRIEPVGDRVTR